MPSGKVQTTIQRIEVFYDGPVVRRYSLTVGLLALDPPHSISTTFHLTNDEAAAMSDLLDKAIERLKGELKQSL